MERGRRYGQPRTRRVGRLAVLLASVRVWMRMLAGEKLVGRETPWRRRREYVEQGNGVSS